MDRALAFLSLGLVLYGIAQIYQFVSKDNIIKHTIRCPYCRKYISEKVRPLTGLVKVAYLRRYCAGQAMCQLHKLGGRQGREGDQCSGPGIKLMTFMKDMYQGCVEISTELDLLFL